MSCAGSARRATCREKRSKRLHEALRERRCSLAGDPEGPPVRKRRRQRTGRLAPVSWRAYRGIVKGTEYTNSSEAAVANLIEAAAADCVGQDNTTRVNPYRRVLS